MGQRVTTTGVVSTRDDNGIWIQRPGCDGDPATSNGVLALGDHGPPPPTTSDHDPLVSYLAPVGVRGRVRR